MSALTILIVDDNRVILQGLAPVLEDAGYRVITADDGDRAVEALLAERPDLIISDIQMPNLDGFYLCKIVRSRPETRDVPFLFLTSVDAPERRRQGFELGADDFIPKPFDGREVVLRVRNILKRLDRDDDEAPARATRPMEGTVGELPLADLLEMVNLHQRNATITLTRPGAERGCIEVRGDDVTHASAGREFGLKAFFRLFTWSDALFKLEYLSGGETVGSDISLGDVEELTMTALFQRLEHDRFLAELGGIDQRFREDPEHEVFESELDADGKYVRLLVQRHPRVGDVLDASGLSDLNTLKALSRLRERGVLRAVTGSD